MIPFFYFPSILLGGITIYTWGTLVALGILLGTFASAKLAKHRKQDEKLIWDGVTWIILGAFLFARIVHVAFYEFAYYAENPLQILAVWDGGWSSVGGFLGAALVGIWYLRKKQADVWAYADTMVFGLPLGLFIGRIGCFLIHDHPGTATDFALGVQYPDGIARHDHGLYLSLNGLLLFLVFLVLLKRQAKTGAFIVTFLIWYGIVRFFLDFLRATDGGIVDERWIGLTPAQYFALLMVILGIWLSGKKLQAKN